MAAIELPRLGYLIAMRKITEITLAVCIALASTFALGQGQDVTLNFVPSQTIVDFALGDLLHTVHGKFQLKGGQIHFSPGSNAVDGEIVVDATSGNSGSATRDRKMHAEILESARYPELTFRPDRVEGKVASIGVSTVQVHGMFGIHGSEHEITVPVQAEFSPTDWTLSAHFAIPYVNWGLKDPSTFILRVEKVVEIDLHATGSNQ